MIGTAIAGLLGAIYTPKAQEKSMNKKNRHNVYLCGSLSDDAIRNLGNDLRYDLDITVFDDWCSAHPASDQRLYQYHRERGDNVKDALKGPVCQMIYNFDREHIEASDVVVLVAPCGKSAHLELGYAAGRGIPTIYYYPQEPERFDVMVNFAGYVAVGYEDLTRAIRRLI